MDSEKSSTARSEYCFISCMTGYAVAVLYCQAGTVSVVEGG